MYPHRIRLRGPWECEIDRAPPRRVTMPCTWADAGLTDYCGIARFTRRFGYPGKADRDIEHIWLTCAGCTGCREVRLNGQLLPTPTTEQFACDVTTILAERNLLEVAIDGATANAGLWGEVALEIRMDAYLANVAAHRRDSLLIVTGLVVGSAPQALELYTLVDNRNVDYRTVKPTPAGEPFQIDLPAVTSTNQLVRVELIHVSTIWYVVELSIP